jgi:tetratricopeptide (TPR) repeat protein
MMDDFFGSEDELEDIEGNELISRYEGVIKNNQPTYLSVDDYEFLFMHYVQFYNDPFMEEINLEMAAKVIHSGVEQYPHAPLLNMFWIYNQFLNGKISEEKTLELLHTIEFPEYERLSQNYHLAAVYIKINALDAARSLYENMLRDAYSDDDKERIYSELIFLSEDISLTLKYTARLLKIAPRREQLLLDELYAHFLFKDDTGISFFKLFVDKFPFSVKGWQCLGEAYSSQFLFENAVDAMNNAIALSNKVEPVISLAGIYRSWGKYHDALDSYKEAMLIEPDNIDFYVDMAEVYHLLEQNELAIYYFGLTLDNMPNHLPALMGMALSLAAQDNYFDAIHYLRQAITLDYAPVEAWLLLSDYYIEIENDEEAIQLYKKATELFPLSADVWLSYSNYYAMMEDMKQACTILNQGLVLMPDNAQLLYRMANYYFLYEDYSSGITYLKCAYISDSMYLNQFLDYDEYTAMLPVVVDVINELMHKNEIN